MPEKLFLDVHHLHMGFTQRKKSSAVVVNDATFQIGKGEILRLVGKSGYGEPVTALLTMSLLKGAPDKITDEEIYLEGNNLLRCSGEEIRKIRGENVSMIFQEAMSSLSPAMRVNAQLVEAILLHTDKTKRGAGEHALKMPGRVGIPDPARMDRSYPHQLSGGMSQRVVIVMATSCNPHLLIADELVAAPDVTIQVQTLGLVRKIQREIHTGILSITYDLSVVAETCSRVIVMYADQIVEKTPMQHLSYELVHSYTRELIASVPKLDSGVTSLPSIPGSVLDLSTMPPGCRFAPRYHYAQDHCREKEPPFVELGEGRKCRCVLVQDKKATME